MIVAIVLAVWAALSVPLALLFARICSNGHESENHPIGDPEAQHGVEAKH